MKKQFLFTILLLIANIVIAQTGYEIKQAMDLFRINKMNTGEWKNWLEESDIDGSPYLKNEFVKGVVYMNSNQQFVDVPLRYNIYNDQVEFKTDDDKIFAISPPEMIDKVVFDENEFEYIAFSIGKKIRKGFFIKLNDGKASLYSRPEVVFKKAEEPGAYKEAEPAKFVRKSDNFYIKIGVTQARKVGNRKDLQKLFTDHQEEIMTFVKKNKIKIKEPDLLELVKYYNSL